MTWTQADWEWGGEPWDFLGEPLAVDVAASVKRRGDVHVELWRDGSDVAQWCEGERGRVPALTAGQADARLDDLRELRDDVFAVLGAAIAGEPPGRDARVADAAARLDARAVAMPVVAQLGGDAVAVGVEDPVDELIARAAAAAIALGREPGELTFCDAPSCGQFYMRRRRGQVWCSMACGTRARVARHAARHRP
jgi:predicted RNA-binding Zn ribbon-like protein